MKQNLLFLHGLGTDHSSWQNQIEFFEAKQFNIIAPDLKGFGSNEANNHNVTIKLIAQDVLSLLHRLKIQQVSIIGLSLGGLVALEMLLSLKRKIKIESLILVSSAANFKQGNRFYYNIRFLMSYILPINYQALIVSRKIFPSDEFIKQREIFIKQMSSVNKEVYHNIINSMRIFNVIDKLGAIKLRSLVIAGKKDSIITPDCQKKLARKLNADYIEINSNHAVNIEKPDDFNNVILEFLQQ